ncbi:MAG: hypothetical protein WC755_04245 [Candidatus Woesearchaeota archaeon]|jgi:hypothetical protein
MTEQQHNQKLEERLEQNNGSKKNWNVVIDPIYSSRDLSGIHYSKKEDKVIIKKIFSQPKNTGTRRHDVDCYELSLGYSGILDEKGNINRNVLNKYKEEYQSNGKGTIKLVHPHYEVMIPPIKSVNFADPKLFEQNKKYLFSCIDVAYEFDADIIYHPGRVEDSSSDDEKLKHFFTSIKVLQEAIFYLKKKGRIHSNGNQPKLLIENQGFDPKFTYFFSMIESQTDNIFNDNVRLTRIKFYAKEFYEQFLKDKRIGHTREKVVDISQYLGQITDTSHLISMTKNGECFRRAIIQLEDMDIDLENQLKLRDIAPILAMHISGNKFKLTDNYLHTKELEEKKHLSNSIGLGYDTHSPINVFLEEHQEYIQGYNELFKRGLINTYRRHKTLRVHLETHQRSVKLGIKKQLEISPDGYKSAKEMYENIEYIKKMINKIVKTESYELKDKSLKKLNTLYNQKIVTDDKENFERKRDEDFTFFQKGKKAIINGTKDTISSVKHNVRKVHSTARNTLTRLSLLIQNY